ncbi:hypothetical protein D3C87_01060 [compost metagenome]
MTLKYFLLVLLTSFGISNLFSQETESTPEERGFRFYNSIEDYLDGKYIDGYLIIGSPLGGSSSLKLKYLDQSGSEVEKKVADLPGKIFTFGGALYRIVGKTVYIVLSQGKLNYYADYLYNNIQYYSEGWDGEMKKFSNGWFEKTLSEHSLLESYKADKPKMERGIQPNERFNDLVSWNVKYFNLLNEKLK